MNAHHDMTLRSLAGDTLIYGTGYILGKVLNFLLIAVYLTWKFDGEEAQYGLYTDFYFYVALLLVFLTFRMETTYFRFASKGEDRTAVFSQAMLILLATSGVWLLILFLRQAEIAEVLEYPGFEKHVIALGLIITLDVMVSVPFAALRLEGRPLRYSLLRLLGILVNITGVVFFLELLPDIYESGTQWASWFRYEDRLYYVFLSNLIGSLVVFIVFLPQYLRIRLSWSARLAKQMLRYAWPLVLVGLAGVINQSSYITFQKYILPNSLIENLSEGGIYAAATRIAILMSLFTIAFNYAAEPFFFKHSGSVSAKEMYAEVARAFTIAGCVLMAFILLYLDVVQFILGESYRSGLYIVPILLLGFFFLGLYYNFSVWYKITDRTIIGAWIAVSGALITIALNLILIPKMEVVGSAWASLACYTFMTLLCYLIGRKYYPVPYELGRIALHVVGVMVIYGISVMLGDLAGPGFGKHLIINTLLLSVYLLILFRAEKSMILSIIRKAPLS
jgi:O-antigen/teichoic acid export membrane protein